MRDIESVRAARTVTSGSSTADGAATAAARATAASFTGTREWRSAIGVLRISRELATQTGWHAHREGQLYSLTKGIMTVETQRGALLASQGRMGWIPGQHEHRSRTYGCTEGWSAYLAPGLSASLPLQPCMLRNSDLVGAIVQRIATADERTLVCAAADRLVAVLMDELQTTCEQSSTLPFPRDRRLRAIASELLRNPDCSWTLGAWAQWGGISSRSLSRGFRVETGLSFGRWRSVVRMLEALELLSSGMAVLDVALRVGYENPSAFIAVFKSFFGTTPAAHFERGSGASVSETERAAAPRGLQPLPVPRGCADEERRVAETRAIGGRNGPR